MIVIVVILVDAVVVVISSAFGFVGDAVRITDVGAVRVGGGGVCGGVGSFESFLGRPGARRDRLFRSGGSGSGSGSGSGGGGGSGGLLKRFAILAIAARHRFIRRRCRFVRRLVRSGFIRFGCFGSFPAAAVFVRFALFTRLCRRPLAVFIFSRSGKKIFGVWR